MVDIEITDEFEDVFNILENTSQHVFLSGKAGTGKSTFLEYFRKNTEKNVVVVAPTGVAAINVSGQTIHSFFKFKPWFTEPGTLPKIRADQRKIYRAIDILVIDEISMVRADLFDQIELFMRRFGKVSGAPFGGCQICIIGDMYQLPPIVTRQDSEVFYDYYETPYFFSSKTYQVEARQFVNINLTKIFRQSEGEFIDVLNKIRDGQLSSNELSWFNQKCGMREMSEDSNPIILTATNYLADRTNQARLKSLPGEVFTYKGKAKGSFEKDEKRLPAALDLELKVGAQVMFLRNDTDKRWANGSIGIVSKLTAKIISIDIGGREVKLEKEKWESIRYEFDEAQDKLVEEVIGSYEQYPLQLAWAVTIHKSQGQTFDDVIIDLGLGAFAFGQTYVALSRCRNLNGIYLKAPMKLTDIKVDERVVDFSLELIA
ncbi:MAG: AAA family ATPase [Rickettsiales bacterium]|jgi:ATP-dependent DNA helicase PIF1|nr:AAA family ATPase [Rickettsiales bacterium]